jgi:hypothetical protein
MGTPGVEGYVSLKVAEKYTRSVSVLSKTECVTKEQPPSHTNFSLVYRNGRYPTPKRMKLDF